MSSACRSSPSHWALHAPASAERLIGAAFQFGPSSGGAYLLNSLAIVVLGGLGNVLGTLVGGLTLGFLQSVGGLTLGDGYRDLVGMALFLLVLAFRPGGFLARRGS